MRLESPDDKVPRHIDRYLEPSEHSVIAVRRNPAILIPPTTTAVGGLLAAVAIGPVIQGNTSLEFTVWLLTGFLFAQLALASVNWFANYFVVTRQRLILISGALTTRIQTMPLPSINDMTLRRSYAGRLFGYGTFIFASHMTINYVPHPERLYRELRGLVSPRLPGPEPSRPPGHESPRPLGPESSRPPGPERNMAMEQVFADALRLPEREQFEPTEVAQWLQEGSDEQRITALALMQAKPDLRNFDSVLAAIKDPRSPFEQYHAMLLTGLMIGSLSVSDRQRLVAVIKQARHRFGSDTDRWLISDRILSDIDLKI